MEYALSCTPLDAHAFEWTSCGCAVPFLSAAADDLRAVACCFRRRRGRQRRRRRAWRRQPGAGGRGGARGRGLPGAGGPHRHAHCTPPGDAGSHWQVRYRGGTYRARAQGCGGSVAAVQQALAQPSAQSWGCRQGETSGRKMAAAASPARPHTTVAASSMHACLMVSWLRQQEVMAVHGGPAACMCMCMGGRRRRGSWPSDSRKGWAGMGTMQERRGGGGAAGAVACRTHTGAAV